MAKVTDGNLETILPEELTMGLLLNLTSVRGGVENVKDEDVQTLISWAEDIYQRFTVLGMAAAGLILLEVKDGDVLGANPFEILQAVSEKASA